MRTNASSGVYCVNVNATLKMKSGEVNGTTSRFYRGIDILKENLEYIEKHKAIDVTGM